MAKNKNEAPSAPVISRIPVPVSDSALVIDLPDGQKLVVGKMTHGTVIEVATWRGTGRPDSRTNRMMLGMINAELEATVTEEFKATAAAEEKSFVDLIKDPGALLKAIVPKIVYGFKWLFDFKGQAGKKDSKQVTTSFAYSSADDATVSNSQETKSNPFSKVMPRVNLKKFIPAKKVKAATKIEDNIDSEVDEWLNQILNKNSKKSAAIGAAPNSDKNNQPASIQIGDKGVVAKTKIAKSPTRKPASKKISASKAGKKSVKPKPSR